MSYQISEQQINSILSVLADVPAKFSFESICILRSLTKVEMDKVEESEVKREKK